MTITEPIGKGIFHGALSLGAEAVLFRTRRPSESYNVGAMPRLRYVFGSHALVRPYLEGGGGGGIWGTLAGTPEQAANWQARECHGSLLLTWPFPWAIVFIIFQMADWETPTVD